MRDTTLTSPEMYMERVAACFYMKYHVYWENITDPRSFIYFILLFYFIIIIIILFYCSFIFLSLKHVYDLNYTLKLLPGMIVESYFFFTYKPVTKVGVIF